MSGCGWVGGRKEKETNDPETIEEKRWDRRARLKCNSKRREPRCKEVNVRGWNTTTS